jgi:pimeloyl-ACP methyl ester carboxylesterase
MNKYLIFKTYYTILLCQFMHSCVYIAELKKINMLSEIDSVKSAIHNSIGWAKNKDFDLLYSIIVNLRIWDEQFPVLAKNYRILAGEYDHPDVHAHAGVINAGIPNSKREIILKSGHLIPLEQPVLFNEAVVNFLNKLPI